MSEQMWNERYSARQRVWSGEPNPWLVDVAATLPGGTALDLGQYFHSTPAARSRVHRMAWSTTAGTLVIVGHDVTHPGGPPQDVRFDAGDVLAALGLAPDDPAVASAQRRTRGDACDVVVELVRR